MDNSAQEGAGDTLQLGEHVAWLRRLARGLVSDAALADDLVQETALAALETPPGDGVSPRAWLARVLRNRLKDSSRRAAYRKPRSHESELVEPTERAADDPLESLRRIESGRTLAKLVLSLEEPTRSTLVLRFWDDLPPREIARRQGVPLATVKSRLARGLSRLRSDLDQEEGGAPGAWLAAVLPLIPSRAPAAVAGITSSWAALAAGALAMKVVLVSVFVVAVALVGTLLLLRDSKTPSVAVMPSVESAARGLAVDRSDVEPTAPAPSRAETRTAAAAPAQSETSKPGSPPEAKAAFTVAARVFDTDGRGLAGVAVTVEDRPDFAVSERDGTVRVVTGATKGVLVMHDKESWVTVRPGIFREGKQESPTVVAAPRISIGGRVTDGFGAPVPGARVDLRLPADLPSRFGQSLASSTRVGWAQVTDADGQFTFAAVPSVAGAEIVATEEAFREGRAAAPSESRDDVLITLRNRAVTGGSALRGRVLRANGEIATEARVSLGHSIVPVDATGLFEIDLAASGGGARLLAIEAGSLVGSYERPEPEDSESLGWPDFVEVRLGSAPLSIRGTVVDENDDPVAGARVWLDDATRFGVLGTFPLHREALAAGLPIPIDAVRSVAKTDGSGGEGAGEYGSATAVSGSNALVQWSTTDAEGKFTIRGLEDRRYVIKVAGESLEFIHESQPIRAGSRSEKIRVVGQGVFARVVGRVVTRRGDPVPGVFISPWVAAYQNEVEVRGGSANILRFFYTGGAKSDAAGVFTLENVPERGLQFHIAGEGIVPSYASSDDIEDPQSFEVVVAARVEVDVEITDLSLGVDSVSALDADGRFHPIYRIYADGYTTLSELSVENGRTGIFALTTDAATLRLHRGPEIVEEITIVPRPGEPVRIVR